MLETLVSLVMIAAGPQRLAVLPVQADQDARAALPGVIDDYILTAAQQVGAFSVIGQDDINTLIGFERQKEILGSEDVSCFAEIAGALGVDLLAVVRVSCLGTGWAVAGKLIDLRAAAVARRTTQEVAGDANALLSAIPGFMHGLLMSRQRWVRSMR
jgi:hypothetical protein